MFIDRVELEVSSGKGGSGCTSFRREKFVVKGGPDGGDGGKGGNVYFLVDSNTDTLSFYKGRKKLKAKNGQPGMGKRMTGKSGEDLILVVPPGTQVFEDDKLLLDLVDDGKKILFLEGGKGGKGNWHFRNASNQAPTYHQNGLPGITKKIRLELKLIADVGLVGYPNVGKSTLISILSNAKPEIANYEFTTLTPKLGIVDVGEFNSFVLADIPGIIEGASSGKGLGIEFLRHIERTKVLLFILDTINYRDLIYQYKTLKEELKNFSENLYNKKFAIALTKVDALNDKTNIKEFFNYLGISEKNGYNFSGISFVQDKYEFDKKLPYFVAELSSVTKLNTENIKYALYDLVRL